MADNKKQNNEQAKDRTNLRNAMESVATMGLLFVAVAVVGPLFTLQSTSWLLAFKWIYAAGALIYIAARLVASFGHDESLRVRRLRRMEVWAGLCFGCGAFFWFYNQARFFGAFSLSVVHETIIFTLAGALVQIIASWMITSVKKKELKNKQER